MIGRVSRASRVVESFPLPCSGVSSDGSFLDDLLAFESGIDPRKFPWYVDHLEREVVDAVEVEAVGRPKRTSTGQLMRTRNTVEAYFRHLGVFDLFESQDETSLRAMQCGAMNALGFVGFQVGEGILVDCGYYRPRMVEVPFGRGLATVPMLYAGQLPERTWANDVRECVTVLPGWTSPILATDANRWEGSFSGLDGIWSLDQLRTVRGQYAVIRRVMAHMHRTLRDLLAARGGHLDAFLPQAPTGQDTVVATLSGVLASTHLCGPYAVADWVVDRREASDEFGVTLSEYMIRFSGYDVRGLMTELEVTANPWR